MKTRHLFTVIGACAKIGFREVLADKVGLMATIMIYVGVVTIFGGVVNLVSPTDLVPFALTRAQMIWYLGTTEYILFVYASWAYKELQNEFQSGQIYLSLVRPFPDSIVRISTWSGGALARFLALLPAYMLIMYILSGSIEMNLAHFLGFLLCVPLAVLMMLCTVYAVGASCLWFIQSEPAWWICQKCMFLLGAILWPFAFYPVWLKTLAWATPFPSMLAITGQWALNGDLLSYALAFGHQVLWAVLFLFGMRRFDRHMLRHIQREG